MEFGFLSIFGSSFCSVRVVQKGCSLEIPIELRKRCDSNSKECHKCNTDRCNSLGQEDYTCVQCESSKVIQLKFSNGLMILKTFKRIRTVLGMQQQYHLHVVQHQLLLMLIAMWITLMELQSVAVQQVFPNKGVALLAATVCYVCQGIYVDVIVLTSLLEPDLLHFNKINNICL